MKTYATMVLGCKVNDYEAAYIEEELNKDYQKVSFHEKADIYLIFTCAVTNIAEAKSRKFIRQARRLNPDAYIVAVGCYVQADPQEELFKEINLLIGSKNKNKIKEYIDANTDANLVTDLNSVSFEEMPINTYGRKGRSFLKIQDGCNQYCSFCIIPYARGKERSAGHEFILKEAAQLAKTSREIVLTGIHTGRYFDGEYHLLDLLIDLEKIDNLKTIRLSSIEITELNNELINFISNSQKMAHHLHIPLQYGSDAVLKAMHRPYSVRYFLNRINEIRRLMPDIAISTDLIEGFPSETEEDFLKNIDTLKKAEFSFIHLFPYARKKGTEADKSDSFIKGEIVKQRIQIIQKIEKEYRDKYLESKLNTITNVFIEHNDGFYSYGYALQYFMVKVIGIYANGSILKVKIIAIKDDQAVGEVIDVIE